MTKENDGSGDKHDIARLTPAKYWGFGLADKVRKAMRMSSI